jgi:hypothetical protein
MHDTDPILTPLWRRARAMFARAVAAMGRAADIAVLAHLPRDLRRRIVAWLAPLEHIVRKLLLAEAAALRSAPSWTASLQARTCAAIAVRGAAGAARSNLQPPAPGRSAGPLARNSVQNRSAALRAACAAGAARSNLDPSKPESWPARFSLSLPRDPITVPDSRAPRIRALWGDAAPMLPHPSSRGPCTREECDSALALARRFEALRRVLENPLPHAQRLARALMRAMRRFPEIVTRYLHAPARTGDFDSADPRLSIDAIAIAFGAPLSFSDSS